MCSVRYRYVTEADGLLCIFKAINSMLIKNDRAFDDVTYTKCCLLGTHAFVATSSLLFFWSPYAGKNILPFSDSKAC